MSDPSQFRKLPPMQSPDLSKVPEGIRKALNVPIPLQDQAFYASLYTYRTKTCVHPHARVHVGWNTADDVAPKSVAVVSLKSFRGDEDLAFLHLPIADLRALHARLGALIEQLEPT